MTVIPCVNDGKKCKTETKHKAETEPIPPKTSTKKRKTGQVAHTDEAPHLCTSEELLILQKDVTTLLGRIEHIETQLTTLERNKNRSDPVEQ